MPSTSLPLHTRLAQALPTSLSFLIHHVVSDSFACPELFPAPPQEFPESTTSESHFLSASIKHDGKPLLVFAVEVYVYTTNSLTTLFVSKADSTGYLQLLKLAPGTPSPIRAVITAFLDWLVEVKRRTDTRLLLALFARAQSQYLFPGSIENDGKHVLDDRGLIRWWCRVLDPLLLRYSNEDIHHKAHAHLIVPGLDAYETRAYFPRHLANVPGQKPRWSASDPLQAIGKPEGLPARCYIPRFPDDPKARFVIDLDDELPEESEAGITKIGRSPGIWKSVKSSAQFWELMAFRQECAAGRLVGFIWAVFEPLPLVDKPFQARAELDDSHQRKIDVEEPTLPTPGNSQHQGRHTSSGIHEVPESALQILGDDLPSPLPSSQPQPQSTNDESTQRPEISETADDTTSSILPSQRTETGIKLSDKAYKHALLTLDTLDYSNLEIALESTVKFLKVASGSIDNVEDWAMEIKGKASAETATEAGLQGNHNSQGSSSSSSTNVISTGSIRSRKRSIEDPAAEKSGVRVLSSSLVRKKPKV